jgi:hypothetical protein
MGHFFSKKVLPLNLTKYGLDFILGDFFTKESGHTDPDPDLVSAF